MIVSKHAIARSKQRGLVPKRSSANKVKRYIKKNIKNNCEEVYYNPKTGAKIYVTEEFTAVTMRNTVVTIYPKDKYSDERDCSNARLR